MLKSKKQAEHLRKLALSWKGKKHTEKTKQILSEKAKLRTGDKSSNWKGGYIHNGKYIYIYSPNHPNKTKENYVCEHRLLMEKKIGRYLKKDEVVHHINGIKTDNRIENLVLIKNQSEHNKKHKIKRNSLGQFSKKIY